MPLPTEKPLAAPQQTPQEFKPSETQQVKSALNKFMQRDGIAPQTIVQLGDMAKAAIKDKALWPVFKQAAIRSNVADETDFQGGVDYRLLSFFVTAGKLLRGAA